MTPSRTVACPRAHHVDLLRVITFACVVLVHTVGTVMDQNTVAVGAGSLLLVEVVLRSPLARPLVARDRVPTPARRALVSTG